MLFAILLWEQHGETQEVDIPACDLRLALLVVCYPEM